ncbi:C-type lectin domain family 17, member A isoform X2 [Perognathus longimembris pacificus]|uniref:C-type lectin domain family 17, member A isoform X2 n=1 Tax=Perognathus longimembris pacificus TaxID=214514 RepID=UPI0020186247|nr:C-type lectin domain family 17, member A isoform X2 [Perognathus longimembris pacificus]
MVPRPRRKAGTVEDEEQDGDYENEAPCYRDLPPKPGFMAPPRPPRAGRIPENPPLPPKALPMTALGLPTVTCPSRQSGGDLEPSPLQPSLTRPTTPVPWIGGEPRVPWWPRVGRAALPCALAAAALLLSALALAVTLTKYQEVLEELRRAASEQLAWRANVTGVAGLAGLRKDVDRVRADTSQAMVELRGLVDCGRVTCPDGWLPFEDKCYYFSSTTATWDEARQFCQESYAHLVIINSFAEQNFISKLHGSPRVYWLGLTDKDQEGEWRWLDGTPVTLSFWDPQEPNNSYEEDCASMNKGGSWNDLSCAKTTYWICERKCSC